MKENLSHLNKLILAIFDLRLPFIFHYKIKTINLMDLDLENVNSSFAIKFVNSFNIVVK